MKTTREIVGSLPEEERREILARAQELIAKEMTLRQIRKARKLTQAAAAKKLRITQDGVSRLEKRSDFLVSTLRKAIKSYGGELSITVSFEDASGAPNTVRLAGLFDDEEAGDRKPSRPLKTAYAVRGPGKKIRKSTAQGRSKKTVLGPVHKHR